MYACVVFWLTQVTGEPAVMYFGAGILRDAGVLIGQGEDLLCWSHMCEALEIDVLVVMVW